MDETANLALFAASLRALARRVARELVHLPRPQTTGWNVTFADDSDQVSMADGLIEEPAFLVGNHQGLVQSLPEYHSVVDAITHSAILRKRLATDSSTGDKFRFDVAWQHTNTLLNHILLPSFNYEEGQFESVIAKIEREVAQSSVTYVVRAYFRLMGPQLSAALPFSDDAVIRPMSKDERRALVRTSRFFIDAGLTPVNAVRFTTVFELTFEDKNPNILVVVPPRPLADYQTALRLVIGRVAFAFASIERESLLSGSVPHAILPFRKSLWRDDAQAFLPAIPLEEVQMDRARAFLGMLAESQNARVVATAVRRFNDALERLRLDDALIDCVVGLESIVTSEAKEEVLRRFRQRLAVLIGRSANDRMDIYAQVAKIYDARSKIAHGDEPKVPLRELLPVAEDYLARVVRCLLEAADRFDPAALDASIIRGDLDFAP